MRGREEVIDRRSSGNTVPQRLERCRGIVAVDLFRVLSRRVHPDRGDEKEPGRVTAVDDSLLQCPGYSVRHAGLSRAPRKVSVRGFLDGRLVDEQCRRNDRDTRLGDGDEGSEPGARRGKRGYPGSAHWPGPVTQNGV